MTYGSIEKESSDWEGEENTTDQEEEESNIHFDRNAFIIINDELSV